MFTISAHSQEKQCFLQWKRKTFALQRRGTRFILQWEARYKNRKDAKCTFLLLFLTIHVNPICQATATIPCIQVFRSFPTSKKQHYALKN